MSIDIRTQRLHLRKLELEDAPVVFRYRSDDSVGRYQSFHPNTLDDVIQFIDANTRHIDVDDAWYQLGIHLHSGELIGDFGIHFISRQKGICEIGYTIKPECQRKGYGKEAAIGVIGYLFSINKKDAIIASIDPRNEPSRRMLEGLGFEIQEENPEDTQYRLLRRNFRPIIAST